MSQQFIRARNRIQLQPANAAYGTIVTLNGQAPHAAKSAGVAFDLFIAADEEGTPYDITNLASLTIRITDGTTTKAEKTVSNFNANVTAEQWQAGTHEHATVVFSGAEMTFTPGTYNVVIFALTNDDALDYDLLGIGTLTLIESYITGVTSAPAPSATAASLADIAALLAGYIKRSNEPGVTLILRSQNGQHGVEYGVDDAGNPITNLF